MENMHTCAEGRQGISPLANEDCQLGKAGMNLETLILRCSEAVAESERLSFVAGSDDVLQRLCAEVIQMDDHIVAYPISSLAEARLKANHLLQMQDRGFDDFSGDDCFLSLLRSLTGELAQA